MSSAERARRYRRRLRDNRAILAVEVDLFGLTDALIERGLVREEDSESRQLVAAAVAQVVDGWANSVTRDDYACPVAVWWGMLTKMRLKAVGTAPATASVSALVGALPRSPELAAAETDLAEARAERETLRAEIAMLSGEHVRAPDAEREREIRELHRRMRDVEAAIKRARQRRNEARLPLAGEVARTLAPVIDTESQRLLGAVADVRGAMATLGEVASISQGFAVASLDEAGALGAYSAPELTQLPYLDTRPLAAIEHFARRLRGEIA